MSVVLGSIISGAASGVAGWLIGRRKRNAEAAGHELENIERALGIYRNIIDDLHSKMKGMEAKMTEMQIKLEEAEAKLQEAEAIIADYRRKYNINL